ncbi:hypothetical protein KP003_02860 [Geomonas nitrogeniifigens]|uniref:hypothetical protein n=1 Tax=Geomonas diazotrophica TaxID=2843197 RepID=UPI001C2CB5C8|nr:hypothetical protein [Geomonas nitrogeniifigens]QXE87365.1 hypothetical protein KP003_02860 [Geomonas nitrogeniifigens]
MSELVEDITFKEAMLRSKGQIIVCGENTTVPTDFYRLLSQTAKIASQLNRPLHHEIDMRIKNIEGEHRVYIDFLGHKIECNGITLFDALGAGLREVEAKIEAYLR